MTNPKRIVGPRQPAPIVVRSHPQIIMKAGSLQGQRIVSSDGEVHQIAAPVSAANFGGKYVLVQRAHIGEIASPRASSAPPHQNQVV